MFQEKIKQDPYDRENMKPVIKSNICTGEQVAGFKDKKSGEFIEVMLIRNQKDMDEFLVKYEITVAEIKKEW